MDGKEGFHAVFKLCYVCLCSVGAWPEISKSSFVKSITNAHHIISILIMFVFANITQTIQLIIYWGDIDVLTTVLSIADLPIANATFMMIRFWFKKKVLQDLTLMVKNDWIKSKTKKEFEIMNKSAAITKRLSTICIVLGECSCLSYLFSYLYLQFVISKNVRLLYLESYIPYDYKKSPNYEITTLCQCMSSFIATASFIGIESFFIVIVMHVCCKLNILSYRIQSLTSEAKMQTRKNGYVHLKREICFIIEQHNDLYRIANEIEDIFNSINFIQLINFTLIFCLLGFKAITLLSENSGTLMEIIFVIGFYIYLSSNLFICCYVSEQLRIKVSTISCKIQSMAVGHAAYKCCWYGMNKPEIKSLMFILLRAQKPFQITAGKFFIFSLDIFSALMKTSASYMSVLIAMKNKPVE